MADAIGAWGGLQVRTTLPEVTDLLGSLSSVLEVIETVLDLGLEVLSIVRTFTTPVLNPIKAILDELVSLCRSALIDFRSLGLYAHLGDYKLLSTKATLSQLKGGYAQYQRRMFTRLTDRKDLRRPNFSADTSVLAVFVYGAVDPSFVDDLLDISAFQSLRRTGSAFGKLLGVTGLVGRNTALPIPVNLKVNYPFNPTRSPSGVAASSAVQLALASSQILGRDSVVLSWSISPAPGSPDSDPSPPIPPGGFLVEVSCYPNGFYAGWMAPAPSGTGGEGGGGSSDGNPSYLSGTYQEDDTGQPLRIFGGIDTVVLGEDVSWDLAFEGGNLRDGATPAFFFRDPSLPETLHNPFPKLSDGRYVNQKTFFIPRSKINAQALTGGTFTLELSRPELPLLGPLKDDGTVDVDHLTTPSEVYFRVLAVTDTVTESNFRDVKWKLQPRRSPGGEMVALQNPFTAETKGVPSETVKVTLPDQGTDNFTLALQTALAVAILSRSDLVPADPVTTGKPTPTPPDPALRPERVYTATGLESSIRDLLPGVLPNPQRYFERRGSSPDSFTRDLYQKVVSLADEITAAQGNLPPALLATYEARFNTLLSWRWSDSEVEGVSGNGAVSQTILESLNLSQVDPGETVLARNLYSLPGYWQNQGDQTPSSILVQAQQALPQSTFGPSDVLASAPMIYDSIHKNAWYVREVIPDEIYSLAQEILGLTSASTLTTGGWTTWRPFTSTSPLGANSEILGTLESFLRAGSAGTDSVANALDNSISFLEQRVKEIQEVLRKIDTFLDLPFQIAIPDLLVLPLLVNGTEGVLSGLAQAENKPTDGPGAYSAGLVFLGGGLPSLLVDLLLLLIGQGE